MYSWRTRISAVCVDSRVHSAIDGMTMTSSKPAKTIQSCTPRCTVLALPLVIGHDPAVNVHADNCCTLTDMDTADPPAMLKDG